LLGSTRALTCCIGQVAPMLTSSDSYITRVRDIDETLPLNLGRLVFPARLSTCIDNCCRLDD